MEIIISEHALFEADRRGIAVEIVMAIIHNPQQRIKTSLSRTIFQSILYDPENKRDMLFRVVVKELRNKLIVITEYKTSQIHKYWLPE